VTTPNEPNALSINYYLRDTRDRKVSITVADLSNRLLRTVPGTTLQGLNTVRWDMRDTGGKLQPGGEYLVTVDIDGRKFAKTARIRSPD
jgi:flagellar hook assembly protein FlgD